MVDLAREEDREVVDVEATHVGCVAVAGARVKSKVAPQAMEEEQQQQEGDDLDDDVSSHEAAHECGVEYRREIGAVEQEGRKEFSWSISMIC